MQVQTASVRTSNLEIRGFNWTIEDFWSTAPSIEWYYQKNIHSVIRS